MSSIRPRVLNFITSNKNELTEAVAVLDGCVELRNERVDLDEIQGNPRDIAEDKCRRAAVAVNGPALVEDTALELHALNGMPGPYIRPFLEAIGNQGVYDLLAAHKDKSATSVCTIAYCPGPGQAPIVFEGRCTGRIVTSRGVNGFAYDPIFEYEGQTFAEMDPAIKNKVSDRGRALVKLKQWLVSGTEDDL